MRGAIFGKTQESAEVKLQQIINDYEFYKIASVVTKTFTKHHCEVTFSNGDHWRTFYPADTARGYRGNVIYIDAALVDDDDALTPWRSSIIPPFICCMVVTAPSATSR